MVRFYVGEITPPQTVSIYTDSTNHLDVTVSDGRKWYSYVLPKDKGLFAIDNDIITKVIVKTNINYSPTVLFDSFIPSSIVEASFKGSNTSNVTDMRYMFGGCTSLSSLDLSGWDISNVYLMNGMFQNCSKLTSLDLSKWDTSKVTSMGSMFFGCGGLTSLDLSGWVINDATSVMDMFYDCDSLTTIRMVGCSGDTIGKINLVKPSSATIVTE